MAEERRGGSMNDPQQGGDKQPQHGGKDPQHASKEGQR